MEGLDPDVPILVVDDSAGIRNAMEVYLKRLGFRNIRTASNVAEGYAAFRDQKSEIVFLDMVLAEKEVGADLAAKILTEAPLTSIVATTALPATHDLVTMAIAEGVRHYLAKPIRTLTLRSTLEKVAAERDEVRTQTNDVTYA